MNPTWLYVAAVFAAAVALARRGRVDLPWSVAGVFYVLVLAFLWKPMTQQYVNLPVDFLQTLPPWAHINPRVDTQNGELNDVVLQIVPWAHQVREAWKSFDVPLWNHQSGSGYALIGNGQSSAFSPLRILALPLPLGYAFTAEAAWKLLIALTFTFLYCRRRGYSILASSIGAVCFGFCTFLIVWLHFPLAMVASFVPAALYQLDLLVERVTYPRFVFAVALWATMLFGGHPETVSHIFFLSLLSLIWILAVERPMPAREALRFVLILGAILTIAAIVAAPQLVPFAEALTKSKRYHELQVAPHEMGYYSDFFSRIMLIQPHWFGEVPVERPWKPATAESITGFAGVLGIAGWLALLIDVIARRRWRSRELFLVITAPIILGIILAWPVISDLFHLVFALAANARLRLLLCFLIAVMAAALVDLMERRHPAGRSAGILPAPDAAWKAADRPAGSRRSLAYLIGVMGVALLLWWLMKTGYFPVHSYRWTAMLGMIPSLLVLLVAAFVPFARGRAREAVITVLGVAVVAEMWKIGRGWNPVLPEKLMYPETPVIRRLKELNARERFPSRIVGTGPVFFPNAPVLYGFEDIRAHDPMSNGRYLGVLRVLAGYDVSDYFAKWTNLETRMLDLLNVRWIVTSPRATFEDIQRYRMVYDGKDGRIFENRDVLPRFFYTPNVILEFRKDPYNKLLETHQDWLHTVIMRKLPVENDQMRTDLLAPRPANAPVATLTMLSATPTEYRMRVSAPRYSLIVSSIPLWPGWKITRNGDRTRQLEVNGTFLGYAVPKGEWDVRVWYDPPAFKAAAAVSLLTILALAAWPFVRSRWRPRRAAAQSE